MKILGFNLPFTKRGVTPSAADDRFFTDTPMVFLGDGTPVTPQTAMKFTAVFAAVRVISGNLAALPLITYKRNKDGGKERATNHPLYKILKTAPNQMKTTGLEFREMLTAHMLLWGNGYAQILRNKLGEVLELYPIHPSKVTPELRFDENTGRQLLVYKVRKNKGDPLYLPADQVLHLRGYRDSGLEGMSPIMAAEKAIKAGLSLESFGANFFDGGAFPSGVLEYGQGTMSDQAKKNLRDSWQELHGGENRGKKIAILEAGLAWKQLGIPQSDAQFLEQRRFQVEEIARIYGVPPHMLGDLSRSTNNNIEQQSQEFVTYCLLPWMKRWEEAIVRDLLDGEDSKYYVEFLTDALLRGDMATRTAAYQTQIQSGILSPNEARLAENRNPYPGGDEFLLLNKVTTEKQASQDASGATSTPSDTPQKIPKNEQKSVEIDEKALETRVKEAFRGPFKEAWGRVLRKEIGTVKTAAKKKAGPEFETWLDEFVAEREQFATVCLRELFNGYTQMRGVGTSVKFSAPKEYAEEVRSKVLAWVANPQSGYERSEEEGGVYWTERLLSYTGDGYETAA